jgi:predicted ABC-type transport system involved in lysophospholipase L1 biosynthesis ATPase subunit
LACNLAGVTDAAAHTRALLKRVVLRVRLEFRPAKLSGGEQHPPPRAGT